ncbi:LysE family translocator [Mameliella sp. CS4]|uniref:LysE family translocator n=1 Tax=Mameliella sp. CS4 TaxID=2862329 RepID=UPI001C5CFA7C|nr:LysE family translocator [Mameliella sp. CS4]MBW4981660.1 LysE family translocator [Mameliella sp. CS4]
MLADYLPSLLVAWGVHALALASPGANVLAVIGTAMGNGRRQALAMSAGIVTGSILMASGAIAGLGALILTWTHAVTLIKVLGAAYLAWLGYRSLRSAATPGNAPPVTTLSGSPARLYRRGLLLQVSNPKAILAYLAIVTLALGGSAPWPIAVLFVLGAALNSALIHALYALTFSTRPMVAFYLRARRTIDGALGSFFCFAAIRLALARP